MYHDIVTREYLGYPTLLLQMFVLFLKCANRQEFYLFLSHWMHLF